MTTLDPDRFEDKYEHYFTELQDAYKRAFEAMSERESSGLIHDIDQTILSESEPFYDGDGEFRIALPDDTTERLPDRDSEQVERVLEDYTDELRTQLRAVFEFES